jgi:hypothetical protein
MPPLLQGIGILSLPWLAELGAGSLRGVARFHGLVTVLEHSAVELGPDRNPWPLLVFAVGLAVALRLLPTWEETDSAEPRETRSRLEAALLAGAPAARARGVGTRGWLGRWLGRYLLATGLTATSMSPALLFTPWMDGRTIAPGILILADGTDPARQRAAALALAALAVNLAALIAARLTSALPRDW